MPNRRRLLIEGYRAQRADSENVASRGYTAVKIPNAAGSKVAVGTKLPKASSAIKTPPRNKSK